MRKYRKTPEFFSVVSQSPIAAIEAADLFPTSFEDKCTRVMVDFVAQTSISVDAEQLSVPNANSAPVVSVVLIFLNAAKYLDEAIQSVFAQTYNHWELILVDDGSTDASTRIARWYAQRFPDKIRYLEHPGHVNRGMSASRNLGIHHARGQYIALLDADDVWLANKLQYQVDLLDCNSEAAMIVSPIEWWYSWTGKAGDSCRDSVAAFPPEVHSNSLIQPPEMLIALIRHATVSTTSSLLRREAVERVGGFEEDFRGMFEDQAFAAKVYLIAPVFVASECHYRWRKHPDSCCAVAVEAQRYEQARFEFLSWLQRYLCRRAIHHPELERVLDGELHKSMASEVGLSIAASESKPVKMTKTMVRRVVPESIRQRIRNWRYAGNVPAIGQADLGQMRRLTPISRVWGFDRGLPVDRYYIERFLSTQAGDIRGTVLEFGDDIYTRNFGASRVVESEILYPSEGNPRATIIADLTRGENIQTGRFDCIICTQTLMFIFDIQKAMHTLHRILKPGGVLLMTLAGVSHHISRDDMERWGDYWRFTSLSARRLCETAFPPENIHVESHGNVLVGIAFLHGLAREEFRIEELDTKDPDYEVLITVRAVKSPISG